MKRFKSKGHGQRLRIKEKGKARKTVIYRGEFSLVPVDGGEGNPEIVVEDQGELRTIRAQDIDTVEEV